MSPRDPGNRLIVFTGEGRDLPGRGLGIWPLGEGQIIRTDITLQTISRSEKWSALPRGHPPASSRQRVDPVRRREAGAGVSYCCWTGLLLTGERGQTGVM